MMGLSCERFEDCGGPSPDDTKVGAPDPRFTLARAYCSLLWLGTYFHFPAIDQILVRQDASRSHRPAK